MDFSVTHGKTYRTMLATGLPKEVVVPCLKQFEVWMASCGPEWAVARVKTLKSCYLHWIAGKPLDSSTAGIRLHTDGTPYGAFRGLFRTKNGRAITRSLNALMIYSGITLKEVSEGQWLKFARSVAGSPSVSLPDIPVSPEQIWSCKASYRNANYIPLEAWVQSPEKRAPVYGAQWWVHNTQVESEMTLDQHLGMLLDDPFCQDLMARAPGIFEDACGIVVPPYIIQRADYPMCPPTVVGSIGFIQERGAKCRVVANPFRVYQAVLSKLGVGLFDYLRTSCPWDCTFDQSRGVRLIQEWLGEGKTVHSVDLSDATNEFPLSVQIKTLSKLLEANIDASPASAKQNEVTQALILFQAISQGKWRIPYAVSQKFGKPFIRWTKGQPLGLFPSFAAFAVTHGALLRSIEVSLGLHSTFVVLGDDVCISDDEVHARYRWYLQQYGCPISEQKSISSNVIAEFAGKVITGNGPLNVEKWKSWSKRDPLGVVRMFGLGAVELLVPAPFREAIYAFAQVPHPVGLGMNPDGRPTGDRMVGYQELFEDYLAQLPVPTHVDIERRADALEALDPWLCSIKHPRRRELFKVLRWHRRVPNRDPSVVRWIEHYNAVVRTTVMYDVPPLVSELRDQLPKLLFLPRYQKKSMTPLERIMRLFRGKNRS